MQFRPDVVSQLNIISEKIKKKMEVRIESNVSVSEYLEHAHYPK